MDSLLPAVHEAQTAGMRLLVCVLLAGSAWADVAPADSSGCRDKTQGVSCTRDDGTTGTCAKATCSKNDYSNGVPPKSVTYECLKCGSTLAAAPDPAPAPAPAKKSSCAAVPLETAMALVALVFFRRRAS